jgi:hypothetical protein
VPLVALIRWTVLAPDGISSVDVEGSKAIERT